MPQFDPTIIATKLFWLIVTFSFLYWMMSRIALPRIGDVLEERQTRISTDLEAAAKLKAESEAVVEAYEKALADARTKAQAVLAEAQKDADAESAKRSAEFDQKINGMLTEAESRITAAKEAAQVQVRQIASDVTGAVGDRLGVPMTEAEVQSALDSAAANPQQGA